RPDTAEVDADAHHVERPRTVGTRDLSAVDHAWRQSATPSRPWPSWCNTPRLAGWARPARWAYATKLAIGWSSPGLGRAVLVAGYAIFADSTTGSERGSASRSNGSD